MALSLPLNYFGNIKILVDFITETNSQQANMLAYYQVIGVGFGFQQELLNKIQKVTADDILRCANKYFNENSVVAILHP